MNKKGFVEVVVVYTFLIIFLLVMTSVLNSLTNRNTLINTLVEDVKNTLNGDKIWKRVLFL